jgi:hypothetical protein
MNYFDDAMLRCGAASFPAFALSYRVHRDSFNWPETGQGLLEKCCIRVSYIAHIR